MMGFYHAMAQIVIHVVLGVSSRDHAQNTTNPVISLVVYNVIPILMIPIILILYHVGKGTQLCSDTGVTGYRVPSPTCYKIKIIGVHTGGPIRIGITL